MRATELDGSLVASTAGPTAPEALVAAGNVQHLPQHSASVAARMPVAASMAEVRREAPLKNLQHVELEVSTADRFALELWSVLSFEVCQWHNERFVCLAFVTVPHCNLATNFAADNVNNQNA